MEEHQKELIDKVKHRSGGWQYLFTDDRVWEKIGEERLLRFAQQCYDMSWYIKPKAHQLDEEIKGSDYQKEFLSIMRDVYGEHAVEILNERPNLTLGNIPNIRVFHPTIYENLGKNFVNFMININYNQVTEVMSFDSIIETIINNPEDMEAFKLCKSIVESGAEESVYNYNRLFRAYSRYSDLMRDCVQTLKSNPDAINADKFETIKDIIVREDESRVLNLEDVESNASQIREKYNREMNMAIRPSQVKKIILNRFFGVSFSPDSAVKFYRTTRNAKKLIESYGIGKIVKYEEMLASEGKPTHLDQSELKILKIMYAVTMYGGETAEETVRVLKDMYKTLDQNAEQVIRPADVSSILAKIPEIYAEEINSRVTIVADLEKKLDAGEKGISKQYHTVMRNGVEHKVPVITLKGADYGFYASTLNANLSGYRSDEGVADTWFEYENGVSHISASLVTHESRKSAMEFEEENSAYFTVVIPKSDDILAMGSDDIFSPAGMRVAEVYAESNDGYKFADEVITKTGQGEYDYNEFVFSRYSMDRSSYSNKILPEAVIRNGTKLTQQLLDGALDFQIYMRERGLIAPDAEFPIILVDRQAYDTIDNELQHLQSNIRASEFEAMALTEAEVSEITTSFVPQSNGDTTNTEDGGINDLI
jgi:hypothetical protein